MLEMFAAAAGELVTAVTITAVLQATVQMYCTVMHPDDFLRFVMILDVFLRF